GDASSSLALPHEAPNAQSGNPVRLRRRLRGAVVIDGLLHKRQVRQARLPSIRDALLVIGKLGPPMDGVSAGMIALAPGPSLRIMLRHSSAGLLRPLVLWPSLGLFVMSGDRAASPSTEPC